MLCHQVILLVAVLLPVTVDELKAIYLWDVQLFHWKLRSNGCNVYHMMMMIIIIIIIIIKSIVVQLVEGQA